MRVLSAVVLGLVGFAAASVRASGANPETVPGFLAPAFERSTVAGSAPERIQPLSTIKLSPDPLDPVLMARWSLNYLTGSISSDHGFASSYGNWPLRMPPYQLEGDKIAIGDSEVRNALAFVLMRDMSGINYGSQTQKGQMTRILAYQQPCGLFTPESHGDTDVLWATAWMTRALIEQFATTGDRQALERAGRALRAVRRYAIESGDDGLLRLAPPTTLNLDGREIHFAYRPYLDFCVVEPFIRYYEVTRDPEMLQIARGLVDGRLKGFGKGHDSGHTHSHWHSLIGIAHLGAVTGDARYLDWVEAQIERWKPLMTDYGWFEATANYTGSETCAVSDPMHVCAYLGRAGRASRYDLVERALRNYLPQEQFFVDDRFLELWRKQPVPDRERQLRLVKRLEGGFLCRTTPSDRWLLDEASGGPLSLEGCCPPTGMTGLYLAWKDAVRRTPRGVYVNLAINRDAPEARVASFLPDRGRVTVTPKRSGDFFVRIPGFAAHSGVRAWRGSRRCDKVIWDGDYVAFPRAGKAEELTVTYPLVAFQQRVHRGGRDYTLFWKGNTLARLHPGDGVWPLFAKIPCVTPPFPWSPAREIHKQNLGATKS